MKVIIKSKRFIIRPYKKGDEIFLAKNLNNRKISRNMHTIPYPYNLKYAKDFLKKALEMTAKSDKIRLGIDMDGEIVGGVGGGVHGHQAEIGYWLAEKCWGKGIGTEVVMELVKHLLKDKNIKRITAKVYPYNKASMRVLEKNGFSLEGVLVKDVKKGLKIY